MTTEQEQQESPQESEYALPISWSYRAKKRRIEKIRRAIRGAEEDVARKVIYNFSAGFLNSPVFLSSDPSELLSSSVLSEQDINIDGVFMLLEVESRRSNGELPENLSERRKILSTRFILGAVEKMWLTVKQPVTGSSTGGRQQEDIRRINVLKRKYGGRDQFAGALAEYFSSPGNNGRSSKTMHGHQRL